MCVGGAAGCGHCKHLAPTWDRLAQEVDTATIAKVDCTKYRSLCEAHEVRGYPTLKLFQSGQAQGTKYAGARSLEALSEYVKANAQQDL